MKTKFAVLVLLLGIINAAALSQPGVSAAQASSPETRALVGVWRGQGEAQQTNLPFVTLTISNEGSSLSGAILLSVVHVENGKPVASTPGIPEPILNPSFEGQTLTFQVKYRGPFPPGISSDNPVLTFRLKVTPPNKAELAMRNLIIDAEAITGSPLPIGRPIQMIKTAN